LNRLFLPSPRLSLAQDRNTTAEDRAELAKFQNRIANAGVAQELKPTDADRADLQRREKIAQEAEAELRRLILTSPADKALYEAQLEARQKEAQRYDQNTTMAQILSKV